MTSNLSPAARRRLAREDKAGPVAHKYYITDPAHRPDLNGELAGAKVMTDKDGQYLMLTEAQAKFYLASGSLEKSSSEED